MDSESRPRTVAASDVWTAKPKTAEELAAEQGVPPFEFDAWGGAPEITDEELNWWIQELRRMRSEGRQPRDLS